MEVIYPGKLARWCNVAASVVLLLGAVGSLLWLSVGFLRGVVILLGAGVLAFVMRDVVDDALHPKPKLRLHKHGIEGAFGRVDWDDISSIRFGTRFDADLFFRQYVILTLRRPPRRATPAGPWASVWTYRTRLSYPELRLQPWARRDRVRRDISHYYRGPINGVLRDTEA